MREMDGAKLRLYSCKINSLAIVEVDLFPDRFPIGSLKVARSGCVPLLGAALRVGNATEGGRSGAPPKGVEMLGFRGVVNPVAPREHPKFSRSGGRMSGSPSPAFPGGLPQGRG
jgi:hypothetical protein